jgi:glycosyltransferase involved in cell wall biosynthesis
MRVVFLTGIWPPDVGGPATHGPDFAAFLRDRDHSVHVVTMGDSEPTAHPVPVESVSRSRPFPVRYAAVAAKGFRLARDADVVYATATYAASAVAAAGRPLVAKLVSDPAYERAWRYGLYRGSLESFARASDPRLAALRRLRTASLGRARRVVVPSRYLAEIAAGWGLDRTRIEVLVNPAPPPSEVAPAVLREGTFVFVGRLTTQKALPDALRAVAAVPGAKLAVVGDGPERGRLERLTHDLGLGDRVVFEGARPREEVLRILAGARAAVLSSTWENLPHAAVEALSVGTPVVATAVGGVPEIVHDGENGILVPAGDVEALAAAIRQVLDDDGVRDRLAAAAQPSVAAIGRDRIYERLEQILLEAAN